MKLYPASVYCIFLLFASPVFSEVSKWKTVGFWDIDFYSESKGCSAFTRYEGGTSFFIGLVMSDELYLEIILINEDWQSIDQGKQYEVEATFGREELWRLKMYGRNLENFTGLTLLHKASSEGAGDLVKEFMNELNMRWVYGGESLGNFSLKDSRAAFETVVDCTKSYTRAIQESKDPFSSGNTDNDPFN